MKLFIVSLVSLWTGGFIGVAAMCLFQINRGRDAERKTNEYNVHTNVHGGFLHACRARRVFNRIQTFIRKLTARGKQGVKKTLR